MNDQDTGPTTLTLWAMSGFGRKTRRPFVSIRWKDVVEQVSPDDARRFAHSILEAAEAAEQDAFMVWWVQNVIKGDDAAAGQFLEQFREWRAKHGSRDGM